jgi:trans-aconitate methyltransferase
VDRNCSFHVQDCTTFSASAKSKFLTGKWDKVFSNAALHWILRSPSTRLDVFKSAHAALKPGGVFVFEMGGHGNVAEIYAALIAGLVMQGFSTQEAAEVSPWFFPSVEWVRDAVTGVGFAVEKVETEYRPTKMNAKDSEGNGGLDGWVRLMGANFIEVLDEEKRDEFVLMVCRVLEPVVTRVEDGSQWLGYVRLRCVARKEQ